MSTNRDFVARRRAAGVGATLLLLAGVLVPSTALAPAAAADDSAENCIFMIELDREICAPVDEDLHAKVYDETGVVVIEGPASTAARGPAAVLASYVVTRLYDDSNYGGSYYEVSSGSTCNGSTIKSVSDIGSSWYGRVSSFATYSGCTVKIFSSTGFGGNSFGFAGSTSYVGNTMNDQTRSLQAR
ncbi:MULTISPECIES: hypothetical protein [unclassified Rathayibacter]|uniref:hypothetical protein n=1 Tax=unclassified Rathayibacter TaxID=2609250 RepID=UPI00188A784B|nr:MULTISPECIES: hypothetical protein [unclassified Rathayibacter]MBF4461157.1 hypothetical protein [Rathayibacter sp. VKM Ac-2879]MBF4502568.1 hypothetical protein [Rathayibacter sp. VKM Ac-2878]